MTDQTVQTTTEPVAWRWSETGTDTDGDPRKITGVYGDYTVVLTLSRGTGTWGATINMGHGHLGFTTEADARKFAIRTVNRLLEPRLRRAKETVALYATPAQPDTGDMAALREVTNMDRVREFHETFGVPVLPSPCIPADRVKMRLEILDEERRELDEALEADDLIEVADALTDMAYLIYGTALEFGIDLNACFAEVHRSNMSKLGADGKPIYREDGKVLKGPSYSPPDLRAALSKPNAQGVGS